MKTEKERRRGDRSRGDIFILVLSIPPPPPPPPPSSSRGNKRGFHTIKVRLVVLIVLEPFLLRVEASSIELILGEREKREDSMTTDGRSMKRKLTRLTEL